MTEAGEAKARVHLPEPTYPKAKETPQELVRQAIMLLLHPHYESHGVRMFTVDQVGDICRFLWRAVNKLEGRAE